MILQLIGAKIRDLRKSKGLSQEKLGEMINSKYSYIGRLEKGQINCSILTLEKVANALEVQFEDLFDYNHLNAYSKSAKMKEIMEMCLERDEDGLERVITVVKMIK
ncbi:helix-turn-helix domain-containing protein [Paenibacillaceae bacterium WGS1546]|uniref:helix-turn-helix domain-containing protein n=1 Tax=Cohnella sp. WGS1546 TaxID=3366810 RepID=UPI00372CF82D